MLCHQASHFNTNDVFDYVKTLHKTNGLLSVITYNDITAASDADKSSVFNQFFHSAFTSSSFVLPDFTTILLLMFCLIFINLSVMFSTF